NVHKKGKGIVGVYPFDIAVTRIEIVHSNARANGFPLRCTMEQV
ncbi:MAG: ATP-dependent Clp protease adaptor ClpS, partial [Spirochaetaceae bacterium]|nr:ATP-dependent Clp protease adaptor ClpS [Spirochaetaceae bacterium]